jgi:hypothetical protein
VNREYREVFSGIRRKPTTEVKSDTVIRPDRFKKGFMQVLGRLSELVRAYSPSPTEVTDMSTQTVRATGYCLRRVATVLPLDERNAVNGSEALVACLSGESGGCRTRNLIIERYSVLGATLLPLTSRNFNHDLAHHAGGATSPCTDNARSCVKYYTN